MSKLDFKKSSRALYQPGTSTFTVLEVPPMNFLMVDGQGDPNAAPAYVAAIETLYGVAYPLKFLSKNTLGKDYVVPPLEGLWWADDMASFTAQPDKNQWFWTLMIRVPDWLDEAAVSQASDVASGKKALPALADLRFERLDEGLCVQILHIGSYDDEGPTLARLHGEFMPANGLAFNGRHHEIYLSDARRVAPEKLRTVLRQPVRRTG